MFKIDRVSVFVVPVALSAIQLLISPAIASAQSPKLVVQPTMNSAAGHAPLRDACLNLGSWPTAVDRMDFFGNAFQFFAQWTNDAEVAQCFQNLSNAGKALIVAAAALRVAPNCSSGQACWNDLAPTLRRLVALNPPSSVYIDIDESITWGGGNPSNAVTQTVEFIRLAREEFPGIGIFLAEAYPAQSISTLTSFFLDVHYGAQAATGTGIQYAMIDHDWNDNRGTIAGVHAIANNVQPHGIQVAVAFWNAKCGQLVGGNCSNMSWYDGLMLQGSAYRAYGWEPDVYYVSDWTGNSLVTIPESNAGNTFTRSLRDFSNTYLPRPTGTHGMLPDDALYPEQERTSVDGRFRLRYQSDGNLVLYGPAGWIWQSETYETIPVATWMQGDGNLVVYKYDPSLGIDRAAWASNTDGHPGAYVVIQSDGNLVIYQGRWPIWSSNTNWY